MPRKNKGNLYKKKGSPFWWYEFQYAGERYRGSTRTATERDARAIAKAAKEQAPADAKARAQREAASAQREADGIPDASTWKIDELALKYGEATTDKLEGWDNVQRDLLRIVEFFSKVIADKDGNEVTSTTDPRYRPVTYLSDIRDGHVKLLVAARRNDRVRPKASTKKESELPFVQPGTVNHTVVRLQALFTYARDDLKLRFNAEPRWKKHKLAVSRKDARIFKSVEKEKARFDTATIGSYPEFKSILDFAYESAKRLQYCASLKWSEIHWDRGVIEKPGKKKPNGEEKIETVEITPEIQAILEPLIGHHPTYVFTYVADRTRDGRVKGKRYPITAAYLKTVFKRTCTKAEIAKFGFHSLRRSGATEFYDATGNDLILTQRFLGHGSPQTTARYIRRGDDDVRAGMEKRAAARSMPPAPASDANSMQEVPPLAPPIVAAKVA